MRPFFLFLFLTTLLSCGDGSASDQQPVSDAPTLDSLKLELKGAKPTLRLRAKVDTAMTNWQAYQQLRNVVDEMPGMRGTLLRAELEDLSASTIPELENAIPESLQTSPILSRLTVLTSQFRMLQMHVERNPPQWQKVDSVAVLFHNSFQDLKLQLNQHFQESVDELLKDFREQIERERDSLAKADTLKVEPKIQQQ